MAATDDDGAGRRPGGRRGPSPAVYRRRRLAVTILALLVLAVLAVAGTTLAGAFGSGAGAADGAPPPGTTSTPADRPASSTGPVPSGPASSAPVPPRTTPPAPSDPFPGATTAGPSASPSPPGPAGGCDPARVVVTAETDQQAYGPDENPVLSLVVRNEGPEACTVNVGTSQMEFVLTSAEERVFSSTDCQHDSQDLERTIEPGGEERAMFEWSRNRTVPGCSRVDEDPVAGTYALTTRLGARSSTPVVFTLHQAAPSP